MATSQQSQHRNSSEMVQKEEHQNLHPCLCRPSHSNPSTHRWLWCSSTSSSSNSLSTHPNWLTKNGWVPDCTAWKLPIPGLLRTAHCEDRQQQVFLKHLLKTLTFPQIGALPGSIPRANPEQLLNIFNDYASVEKDGRKFMTASDFIRK